MASERKIRRKMDGQFHWVFAFGLLTLFQLISFACVLFADGQFRSTLALYLTGFLGLEWLVAFLIRLTLNTRHLELELWAFFLSGIGITVCATVSDDYALKQLFAIVLGLVTYALLLLLCRNVNLVSKLQLFVAIAAVGVLGANLVLAKTVNDTLNWIHIGSFSIQPSELVKIAFVFVGAATLDKLQTMRSLTSYLIFAVICLGALFLMRDFGTALIFFVSFLVIAFMRSGDIKTLSLATAVCAAGATLVIYFKPYVANRFLAYRHVWEHAADKGYQQTRVLTYSASGGLFGLGIGNGRLRHVYAATTDLVFGMLCEEWGMLLAFAILLSFALIVIYSIHTARHARSTFYSIAATAAACMMLFQLSLNVFGVTDLLPLTGVTFPFVSRGGSSMICSWGLLAFMKVAGANLKVESPYEAGDEDA